jgi:hypothetical protein
MKDLDNVTIFKLDMMKNRNRANVKKYKAVIYGWINLLNLYIKAVQFDKYA